MYVRYDNSWALWYRNHNHYSAYPIYAKKDKIDMGTTRRGGLSKTQGLSYVRARPGLFRFLKAFCLTDRRELARGRTHSTSRGVIAYDSRILNGTEKNYSATELEGLTAV